SSSQSACDSGGRTPAMGSHSVMERPDPVSRVAPPTPTSRNTKAASTSSHVRTPAVWAAALLLASAANCVSTCAMACTMQCFCAHRHRALGHAGGGAFAYVPPLCTPFHVTGEALLGVRCTTLRRANGAPLSSTLT